MPRCHKENTYPDRNLNFIGLTHEMIQYYDQKKLPESYLDFIENTITYKNKNTQKSTSRKIRKTQMQNLTTKEKEKNVPFRQAKYFILDCAASSRHSSIVLARAKAIRQQARNKRERRYGSL